MKQKPQGYQACQKFEALATYIAWQHLRNATLTFLLGRLWPTALLAPLIDNGLDACATVPRYIGIVLVDCQLLERFHDVVDVADVVFAASSSVGAEWVVAEEVEVVALNASPHRH